MSLENKRPLFDDKIMFLVYLGHLLEDEDDIKLDTIAYLMFGYWAGTFGRDPQAPDIIADLHFGTDENGFYLRLSEDEWDRFNDLMATSADDIEVEVIADDDMITFLQSVPQYLNNLQTDDLIRRVKQDLVWQKVARMSEQPDPETLSLAIRCEYTMILSVWDRM